jgi:hypothetical protein
MKVYIVILQLDPITYSTITLVNLLLQRLIRSSLLLGYVTVRT